MDHRMVTANRKRANKPHNKNKTKKKGPLKVVYITNPIKFNASASEFRSLVQELTGKDSDVPEPARFPTADDGTVRGGAGGRRWEAAKDHKHQVHAVEEGRKIGHTITSCDGGGGVEHGSDPLMIFGSYDDDNDDGGISTPHMMDGFEGLMASSFWSEGAYNLDVGLKRQS